MIAVVPVRAGELPIGGDEAVAEAGGRAILIGDGTEAAAALLHGIATEVRLCEQPTFAPGAWAEGLAPLVHDEPAIVLPANPDGRDLAPRLAFLLDRPLLAGAVAIGAAGTTMAHQGGRVMEEVRVDEPFVATLQPGVRGVERDPALTCSPTACALVVPDDDARRDAGVARDVEVLEVLPADPATMDLAEAGRIVGGGAGLGSADTMHELSRLALAFGASYGATRVVTDWGWAPFERQIGTTGVTVHPQLYLAFGISGAVQHTAGLGDPEHCIAVNTDASCPMMGLADLAVVADAPALVAELGRRFAVSTNDDAAIADAPIDPPPDSLTASDALVAARQENHDV
jgi:electron transfer flavoprotein alpha subunit